MAVFQDLPAELREQILSFCLPTRIDLGKPFPPAVLSLLQTSNQTNRDVRHALQLLDRTVTIAQPSDLPKLVRLADSVRVATLHLQIYYHSAILTNKQRLTATGDDGMLDAWTPHIQKISLAAASLRTILFDLTPAPQWLLEKRPNWLASHVNDSRVAKQFVRSYVLPGALGPLLALRAVCGPDVDVQVTGRLGERSRRHLSSIVGQAQRAIPTARVPPFRLTAVFLPPPPSPSPQDGRADNGLSLFHAAQSFGVQQHQPGREREPSDRPGPRANLGWVVWSSAAHSLYYTQALEDEMRTRRDVATLLGLGAHKIAGEAMGEVWFEPAEHDRRKLIHHLCRGLDLRSESDDWAVGTTRLKRVRVSFAREP